MIYWQFVHLGGGRKWIEIGSIGIFAKLKSRGSPHSHFSDMPVRSWRSHQVLVALTSNRRAKVGRGFFLVL